MLTSSPPHLPARALLVLLLILSGCLPSSCRREQSRALLPADSLSRALAFSTPEDTLRLHWAHGAEALPGLTFPRTLAFGPDNHLYASDAQANTILVLDSAGALVQTIEAGFEAPYIAGFIGDTLVVFNPAPARFDFVARGSIVRSVAVPGLPADPALLRYGSVWGDGLAFKGSSESTPPFIVALDRRGAVTGRVTMDEAFWRHAGLLRNTGDTLFSLSFYQPVITRFMRDSTRSITREEVPLSGFDSPMLARTRLFLQGEEHEPPLLSPSAAPADTLLFALNMRPGWVQIDAFGTSGKLVRRLVQPQPGLNRNFFPIYLAARASAGGYDLAVAITQPVPRIVWYRWEPAR